MSKLKRCPLCNSELELDTDKRFYIHPLIGCYFDCLIIKADNENSIEKWNTRKPMERIVERLEYEYHEIDKCKKESYEDGEWERFDMFANLKNGIGRAIVIVKEEGGMNE